MKHRSASRFINNFLIVIFAGCIPICLSSCVKQTMQHEPITSYIETKSPNNKVKININTATQKELETLPVIGEEMAARIIEHREQYGRYRRAEHLLLVRGMSDNKFRKLREFVTVNDKEK